MNAQKTVIMKRTDGYHVVPRGRATVLAVLEDESGNERYLNSMQVAKLPADRHEVKRCSLREVVANGELFNIHPYLYDKVPVISA